jgi:uncharacterized membrane protein YczE
MIVYQRMANIPFERSVAIQITVVSVVLRIGFNLDLALSLIASSREYQCDTFSFAVSISIIALFTIIPIRATNQIRNIIEYGFHVTSIPNDAPINHMSKL